MEKRGKGKSGSAAQAEGMATGVALEVIEQSLVDDAPDSGASGTTRRTASENAEQRAGQTAQECSGWASERTGSCADFSAAE
jgi:hypothetical protein